MHVAMDHREAGRKERIAVSEEDCRDRLRFRLNDESGVLRVAEFAIGGASACREVEETLQAYLVNRALADVDPDDLLGFVRDGDGDCVRAVVDEVRKYQRLFG
jgi:hypothetical protein